jgi:methylase of polypeptide subunit release factors
MELYDPGPALHLLEWHRKLRYPYLCRFGGARLRIAKGVFCPTLTHASSLLLASVQFEPGQRVLDVFSGSGAFAILAALSGAHAVAVDISASAAECAIANAALNGVQDEVDVRLGTLEDCVSRTEKFDLIVANPPLLPSRSDIPKDDIEAAVYDPGFRATVGFFNEVGYHLDRHGRCCVVTSDVLDRAGHDVDRLCIDRGLAGSLVAKLDVGYETYRVHELTLTCEPSP